MEKGNLLIVIVVIVALVIILATTGVFEKITGHGITQTTVTCTDTDNGFDKEVKGVTTQTTASSDGKYKMEIEYTDYCISKMRVKDFICTSANRIDSKRYYCDDGYTCMEGICVKQ